MREALTINIDADYKKIAAEAALSWCRRRCHEGHDGALAVGHSRNPGIRWCKLAQGSRL